MKRKTRTALFWRSKALRYWIDNRDTGRYDLNKFIAVRKSEPQLKKLQRKSSKRRKGLVNRRKAIKRLASR